MRFGNVDFVHAFDHPNVPPDLIELHDHNGMSSVGPRAISAAFFGKTSLFMGGWRQPEKWAASYK